MTLIFGNFPETLGMSWSLENSETSIFLHCLACGSPGLKKFPKPRFSTFGVFTKYRCCNPSKWPQMPQKWVNTTPFGSGHTLGTSNHGSGPSFCCFITLFGARGSPLHTQYLRGGEPRPPLQILSNANILSYHKRINSTQIFWYLFV